MKARATAWSAAALALLACIVIAWPRRTIEVDPQLRELSGTYVRGGHGMWTDVLTIDADGRFERAFQGCAGAAHYVGTVMLSHGWLTLHPKPTLEDRWRALRGQVSEMSSDPDSNTFHVVTWDDRVYLIEGLAMEGFCNFVNQGREPRNQSDGAFFLRAGSWNRAPAGLPVVPPDWQHMLLQTTLEATIAELIDGAGSIDLGLEDGLQQGMILMARDVPTRPEVIARGGPPTQDHPLVIAELETGHCLVVPQYPNNSPPLKVGTRVTSRAVDR